jgi:D-glycero-alpha-D-manno-heptose-7-phosphate kinase
MVIARAPLRISFGGGGTDLEAYYHQYGGLVLSAAISRYCYVVATEPSQGGIHITAANLNQWESFPSGTAPAVAEPLALPKAAIERFAGELRARAGVSLLLASDVPPGTGLGSSSAMAVALLRALGAFTDTPLTPDDVADLACRLEIERLGMPIGKQDQYASAFGGLNAIEFTAQGVQVNPLRLTSDTLAALARRLLLFSTGRTRDAASVLRTQQRDTRSNPAVIASLHALKSLAAQMCDALENEQLDCFGGLMNVAWQRKKQLARNISSQDIDGWYTAAREAGALGGKIAGAGGGGFLLLYCPPRRQHILRRVMERCGLREMSFDFDFAGGRVIAGEETASTLAHGEEGRGASGAASQWAVSDWNGTIYNSEWERGPLAQRG